MWVSGPTSRPRHITLETHIRDVCGCIEAEELQDVILCGHSYGGMVITGVADRMAGRIKALVYLDAFVPEHGQSLTDLLRHRLAGRGGGGVPRGSFHTTALQNNSGLMAPIPAEMFGIKA